MSFIMWMKAQKGLSLWHKAEQIVNTEFGLKQWNAHLFVWVQQPVVMERLEMSTFALLWAQRLLLCEHRSPSYSFHFLTLKDDADTSGFQAPLDNVSKMALR